MQRHTRQVSIPMAGISAQAMNATFWKGDNGAAGPSIQRQVCIWPQDKDPNKVVFSSFIKLPAQQAYAK